MKQHRIFGLDIAKNIYHLIDPQGQRKKLRRGELLRYFAQQETAVIALEACGGAHHWGRQLTGLGHEVVLLPPQHVKAYLRGQKNDFNDAQAIAEAASHAKIRPVPIKTLEQQDQHLLLLARQQLIGERTRLVNQLRALLYEYGIVLAQGITTVRRQIPGFLEEANNGLTLRARAILSRQYARLKHLDDELAFYDQSIAEQVKQDEDCQRLQSIPGFGPIVSCAFKSWVGNGQQFKRGREASAAMGLVPRQHSSGDRQVLLGITKRGDPYLRGLLIHGARAVAIHAKNKSDALSQWVVRLIERRGFNKAVVALANKLVRMAWVLVARGERYRAPA